MGVMQTSVLFTRATTLVPPQLAVETTTAIRDKWGKPTLDGLLLERAILRCLWPCVITYDVRQGYLVVTSASRKRYGEHTARFLDGKLGTDVVWQPPTVTVLWAGVENSEYPLLKVTASTPITNSDVARLNEIEGVRRADPRYPNTVWVWYRESASVPVVEGFIRTTLCY